MSAIKNTIFWFFIFAFLFTGFWMVIVNNDSVSLNLLFTNTGPVNVGFVIFLSLTIGVFVGFISGSFSARLSLWRKAREAQLIKAQADQAAALASEREQAKLSALTTRDHEPPAPPPVY